MSDSVALECSSRLVPGALVRRGFQSRWIGLRISQAESNTRRDSRATSNPSSRARFASGRDRSRSGAPEKKKRVDPVNSRLSSSPDAPRRSINRSSMLTSSSSNPNASNWNRLSFGSRASPGNSRKIPSRFVDPVSSRPIKPVLLEYVADRGRHRAYEIEIARCICTTVRISTAAPPTRTGAFRVR